MTVSTFLYFKVAAFNEWRLRIIYQYNRFRNLTIKKANKTVPLLPHVFFFRELVLTFLNCHFFTQKCKKKEDPGTRVGQWEEKKL